jgi:hypothetical protein
MYGVWRNHGVYLAPLTNPTTLVCPFCVPKSRSLGQGRCPPYYRIGLWSCAHCGLGPSTTDQGILPFCLVLFRITWYWIKDELRRPAYGSNLGVNVQGRMRLCNSTSPKNRVNVCLFRELWRSNFRGMPENNYLERRLSNLETRCSSVCNYGVYTPTTTPCKMHTAIRIISVCMRRYVQQELVSPQSGVDIHRFNQRSDAEHAIDATRPAQRNQPRNSLVCIA